MAGKTITAIGFEPDLHDLIEDPIIKLLMKKDGVQKEALLEVINSAREDMPSRPTPARAQSLA